MLGPSGAGKSTLFRALVGEIAARRGHGRCSTAQDVTRAGRSGERARAGVGYVPQTPSVLWDLTVRDNLDAFRTIVHGAAPRATRRGGRGRARVGARAPPRRPRRRALRRASAAASSSRARSRARRGSSSATSRSPASIQRGPSGSATCCASSPTRGRRSSSPTTTSTEALRVCTRALLLLDGAVAVAAPADASRSTRSCAAATSAPGARATSVIASDLCERADRSQAIANRSTSATIF